MALLIAQIIGHTQLINKRELNCLVSSLLFEAELDPIGLLDFAFRNQFRFLQLAVCGFHW